MWADEEEPQWGADDTESTPAAGGEGEAAPPAAGGEAAPPAEGEAPAGDQPVVEEKKKRDPDRPVYFRHWVRPRFLQYSYIYDYRKNYYDDVLDFLDRRTHGISRDIPRPQTWAERALRTYTQKLGRTEGAIKNQSDEELIHNVHHVRAVHHFHSKNYYSRKLTTAY